MLSSSLRLLWPSLLPVFSFFILFIIIEDRCRQLKFTPEKAFDGKRLINHVIRVAEVTTKDFCENVCFMEPDCVSINLDKRVSGHGEYKCELNNVTHERHEHDLKKEDNHFYHAAEVGVALLANTHFKWKKKLVSGRNRCNCCLNSNITVNISIFSIIIIVGLNAARFPFYSYFNVWYYFRFRALVLITLAITILLVKAVLLTKDIAVCVSLGSKVQGVRKVIPALSNRP